MTEASSGEPGGADERVALVDRVRALERFRFTVTRPVGVLVVFMAMMVFGAFSIRLLPLNLMPDISYPKMTIRTEYDGAAPAEVENDLARPLEEALGVVTGVTYEAVEPWPTEAAGQGSSLELIDLTHSSSQVANWSASTPGGTPGAPNSAQGSIASLPPLFVLTA